MVMFKLIYPWCFAVVAFCGTLGPARGASCEKGAYKVVLDTGHTEQEPGAISARGVPEYQFNINLAQDIKNALVADGFMKTFLLITKGRGKSALKSRSACANRLKADLFLSIHHDSVQPVYLQQWTYEGVQHFSDKFNGYSVFVSHKNANKNLSFKFALLLAKELQSRGLSFSKHHAEDIPGERKALLEPQLGIYQYDNLSVLRETAAPAVLLEAGIIVNREEEVQAASPSRRSSIASAVASSVNRFCEVQRKFGLMHQNLAH